MPEIPIIHHAVPSQTMEMKSPTIAVACVFVSVVVEVKTVPEADVLKWITCDALVTVNPAVVFPQTNVNSTPFAAFAGNVHDGLPLVATLMNTPPDCAAVRTTVAPASALFVVLKPSGPVGAAVNATVLLKVAAPPTVTAPVGVLNVPVEPEASKLFDPSIVMFFWVLSPWYITNGRYPSMYGEVMVFVF